MSGADGLESDSAWAKVRQRFCMLALDFGRGPVGISAADVGQGVRAVLPPVAMYRDALVAISAPPDADHRPDQPPMSCMITRTVGRDDPAQRRCPAGGAGGRAAAPARRRAASGRVSGDAVTVSGGRVCWPGRFYAAYVRFGWRLSQMRDDDRFPGIGDGETHVSLVQIRAERLLIPPVLEVTVIGKRFGRPLSWRLHLIPWHREWMQSVRFKWNALNASFLFNFGNVG